MEGEETTLHAWVCVAEPYKRRSDGLLSYRDWLCRGCGCTTTLRADLEPKPSECHPRPEEAHKHWWRDVGVLTATRQGRQVEVWDIACIVCFESRRLVLEKGQMQRLRTLAAARARARRALVAEAVVPDLAKMLRAEVEAVA